MGGPPKGHAPYPGCEKGGAFGYLGSKITYSDETIDRYCKELVEWIKQDNNIWLKNYFLWQDVTWDTVKRLMARSPKLKEAVAMAKDIQEGKLLQEPYDLTKKKDGYHARWMLARHHKGDWEDKAASSTTEEQEKELDSTMTLFDYLKTKAGLDGKD
jgi:hypothetical protein